jgi:hypothetical protein
VNERGLGFWNTALTALVLLAGIGASPATAADYSWSGAAPAGSAGWSNSGNWSGGTAPSGTVGTLTFPTLSSGCSASPPTGTCYVSSNDVGGINADGLSIDNSGGYYTIGGSGIHLGAGGLTVTGSAGSIGLPITINASQTWSISGGLQVHNNVSGPGTPLAINLNPGLLALNGADIEVGPVAITGADPTRTGRQAGANGEVDFFSASLNASSGAAVHLTDARLSGGGTIGPLTSTGGWLVVGTNGPSDLTTVGSLAVAGTAKFDSATLVSFLVNQAGTTAGTDYGQISGADIDLDGASLDIGLTSNCPTLTYGDTLTLVSTTGSVTGAFAGVPDGATVMTSSTAGQCHQYPLIIHYTAHSVTATVGGTPPPVLGVETAPHPSSYLTFDRYGSAENGVVTFAGTVTPGSQTPYWWFEYGRQDSSRVDTQPSICDRGQCEAAPQRFRSNPVHSETDNIEPYRAYWYRLVAEDGASLVRGAPVTFVPGDRFNPDQFDPTGKYQLIISCSDPCAQLAKQGSTAPRSGTAAGELVIDNWDSSKYQLTGGIKLSSSVDGDDTQDKGLYSVSGLLDLSRVSLSFNNPLVVDFPFPHHTGQLPVQFTLAGEADYGPLIQARAAPHFEPVLGGSLGNNGMWLACYESLAKHGCAPTDHPEKQRAAIAAEALGAASLATIGVPPLSAALGVLGLIEGVISLDPPDRHYHHVARPLRIPYLHVSPGRGISKKAARAMTALSKSLARAASDGSAFITAFQRYQGAFRATAIKPTIFQLRASLRYGHAFVADCQALATILHSDRKTLRNSRLGRKQLGAAKINHELRVARRHGLPIALASRLLHFGVSRASVVRFRKLLPRQLPFHARTALGAILDPRFEAGIRAYSAGLERYLSRLPQ